MKFLAQMVAAGEHQCVGADVEFKGVDRETCAAFWRVDCTSGSSFLVLLPADMQARVRVLSCKMMKALDVLGRQKSEKPPKDICFEAW